MKKKLIFSLFVFILASMCLWSQMAIGRFNVVPLQEITDPFNIGVVAFHKNEIQSVHYSISDGVVTTNESSSDFTINPRTGIQEFWITLDPALYADGPLTVTATVVPYNVNSENHRVLTIKLYNSRSQSPLIRYVSGSRGNDSSDGTLNEPFRTIPQAVYSLKGFAGGKIYIIDEGSYTVDNFNKPEIPTDNSKWITIEALPGLSRDNVIITRSTRDFMRIHTLKMHWKNVSFDISRFSRFVGEAFWFDESRFYNPDGWLASYDTAILPILRDTYYATDCLMEDSLYGFTYAKLIRNCRLYKISGDALQGSEFIMNTIVDTMDGTILDHHTDLFQVFGEFENGIIFNLDATNLTSTQGFFLEPTYHSTLGNPQYEMANCAFVNINIYHNPTLYKENPNFGGPPYSQLMSQFNHILFKNLVMPGQQFMIRNDIDDNNQKWMATDIIFENTVFHYMAYYRFLDKGIPEGIILINEQSGEENYTGPPSDFVPGMNWSTIVPNPSVPSNAKPPRRLKFL